MKSSFFSQRSDLELSLLFLAVVVALALTGLAFDSNWPKFLRVATAFVGYAVVLLIATRRSARPPLTAFVLAGAVAGLLSGLVRPEPMPMRFVLTLTLAAAALLGPAHFFGLKHAGRLRQRMLSV
ncbi:MAG: hypothetical protein V4617_01665 [Gemmatimonadota bacterium]